MKLFFLSAACFLAACGTFTLDPVPANKSVDRRVYVNDSATNDSLRSDLIKTGVKFVLQPGQDYKFSVNAPPSGEYRLNVYYFKDNVPSLYKTVSSFREASREVFSFASNKSAAQFFMAQMSVPKGQDVIPSISRVTLGSVSNSASDTIQVRLLFIRTLRKLTNPDMKAIFADSLFKEMGKILTPYGVVISGTYEIVEPAGPALVFPFSNTYIPLPGTRIQNNAHLYLVDSISIPNSNPDVAGEVLGFAPREVVDLDNHRESRVVLSAAKINAQSLAITAAHELGHFFGLRHTISTKHDILQDNDQTNVEDGFTDTPYCRLAKSAAERIDPVGSEKTETPYCLRLAGAPPPNPDCTELNLMYPRDFRRGNQLQLTAQQAAFLRKNIAMYQR